MHHGVTFTLALPKCFHPPYLIHVPLTTKIYRWSQLIIVCALKGCCGIVFIHGVQMGGWAGGRVAGKVCPGCISETVKCRKLILGRDIG